MLDFSSFGSCGLQAILLVSFDVSRFSLVTLLMLCYLNSCSYIIIILHLKNLGFAKTLGPGKILDVIISVLTKV